MPGYETMPPGFWARAWSEAEDDVRAVGITFTVLSVFGLALALMVCPAWLLTGSRAAGLVAFGLTCGMIAPWLSGPVLLSDERIEHKRLAVSAFCLGAWVMLTACALLMG